MQAEKDLKFIMISMYGNLKTKHQVAFRMQNIGFVESVCTSFYTNLFCLPCGQKMYSMHLHQIWKVNGINSNAEWNISIICRGRQK